MSAWLRILGCILSVVGLSIALQAGFRTLQGLPRYQVDTSKLVLRPPVEEAPALGSHSEVSLEHAREERDEIVAWVYEQLESSLPETYGEGFGWRSAYDDELLDDIAATVASDPWVRRVTRAQRLFPSQIVLDYEVRIPVAAIRQGDHVYLVDREGVRLPGEYETVPPRLMRGAFSPPVITGVDPVGAELPAPGVQWRSEGIPMGFAMAALLKRAGVPEQVAIHAIDVSYSEHYRTRLVTIVAGVHRARVHWGKSPLERDPVEASDEQKLQNLARVLHYYPGLAGLVEASVAGQQPSITEGRLESRGDLSR